MAASVVAGICPRNQSPVACNAHALLLTQQRASLTSYTHCSRSAGFRRYYSTQAAQPPRTSETATVGKGGTTVPVTGKATEPTTQAAASEASTSIENLSKKEQLKRAFKEYGATIVVFHVGISLISLGGFYLLVSR